MGGQWEWISTNPFALAGRKLWCGRPRDVRRQIPIGSSPGTSHAPRSPWRRYRLHPPGPLGREQQRNFPPGAGIPAHGRHVPLRSSAGAHASTDDHRIGAMRGSTKRNWGNAKALCSNPPYSWDWQDFAFYMCTWFSNLFPAWVRPGFLFWPFLFYANSACLFAVFSKVLQLWLYLHCRITEKRCFSSPKRSLWLGSVVYLAERKTDLQL